MIIVSKHYQPITILHPKLGESVTLLPNVITSVKDSFRDLPTLKAYEKAGFLVVSNRENEAQENKNIDEELLKRLKKLNITFSGNEDLEILKKRADEAENKYNELYEMLLEKGVKVTKKVSLATLEKLANKKQ